MKSKYLLLDTNIVSYIMKNTPQAQLYEKHLSGKILTISFITVGELWAGAEWANWGDNKKAQLRATICKFVVIPYNDRIAEHYGAIIAHRKKNGVPISCADAWIAACARSYDIPLVTHNAKDFTNIPGLQVITANP